MLINIQILKQEPSTTWPANAGWVLRGLYDYSEGSQKQGTWHSVRMGFNKRKTQDPWGRWHLSGHWPDSEQWSLLWDQARFLNAEALVREQEEVAKFWTLYSVFKLYYELQSDGQQEGET